VPPGWRTPPSAIDLAAVRAAIHAGRKIALDYRDKDQRASQRIVWPILLGYFQTTRLICAWCETRRDFRSFRADRIVGATFLDERYPERPAALRAQFRKKMEAERAKWLKAGKAV
jgi:predicted DNA-binding transcriptional regulator YafY